MVRSGLDRRRLRWCWADLPGLTPRVDPRQTATSRGDPAISAFEGQSGRAAAIKSWRCVDWEEVMDHEEWKELTTDEKLDWLRSEIERIITHMQRVAAPLAAVGNTVSSLDRHVLQFFERERVDATSDLA